MLFWLFDSMTFDSMTFDYLFSTTVMRSSLFMYFVVCAINLQHEPRRKKNERRPEKKIVADDAAVKLLSND